MKNYLRIYRDYFNSEDNVIIISENANGQLILAIEDNLICIGYIIDTKDEYGFLMDMKFEVGIESYIGNEKQYVIYNPKAELYKIIMNIIFCMNYRKIDFDINTVDVNNISNNIDAIKEKKYNMSQLKSKLEEIVEKYINWRDE
jgi:hypothetical protein